MIEAGDPIALDAAIQAILAIGVIRDPGTAEREARSRARAVLAEAVHNSRITLETLESVTRGLSGVTGRKALFLVSDGFIAGLSAGLGFDMRRIADAATRAGVVILCARRPRPDRIAPGHARGEPERDHAGKRGHRRGHGPAQRRGDAGGDERHRGRHRRVPGRQHERPAGRAADPRQGHGDLLPARVRTHEPEARRRFPPHRGAGARRARREGADTVRLLRRRRSSGGRGGLGRGHRATRRTAAGRDGRRAPSACSAHRHPGPAGRGLREP